LNRIEQLMGTDEGFYALALHSFIECFIDYTCDDARVSCHFPDKLEALEAFLERQKMRLYKMQVLSL